MINRLLEDLYKIKIDNIPEKLGAIAVGIVFGFIIYLGYTGATKFITSISEDTFINDVKKKLSRINNGNETSVIQYFDQQNKDLTCKAMIEYLNRDKKENTDIIRLEVFPKFCLKNNEDKHE